MTCETYLWVVAPSLVSEDPEKSENTKMSVCYKHCLYHTLAMNNIYWHRKMGESYQQAKMVFPELAKKGITCVGPFKCG